MWQVWYCVAALSGLAALFFEVLVKKKLSRWWCGGPHQAGECVTTIHDFTIYVIFGQFFRIYDLRNFG